MVMVGGRSLPRDEWHRKYYWDLRKNAWNCSRCSICKWVDSWEVKSWRFARICPSVHYYLYDAFSCQGRMDVSLALIDGRLKYEDSPLLLDVFYRCNLCGGCDAMCKRVQDMEPLRVIQEMRFRLVSDGQLHPVLTAVVDHLRKEDNIMMMPRTDRGKWAEGLAVKDLTREKADVVFHAGCRASFDPILWPALRSAIRVLIRAGVDVGIMGQSEVCCGGRVYEMGYLSEFTKYAEHNIQLWREAGVRTVVTSCSDGYYTFKRLYPDYGLNIQVLHVVEFIEQALKSGRLRFERSLPVTVTYHDPCHIGRRLPVYVPGEPIIGMYEGPRQIITRIPGVQLIEMERIREYAWCCGAGGGVYEAYPELNKFSASERLEEAEATGAEMLVSACTWCEGNFLDAVARSRSRLKVVDLVQLVEEALT